MIPLKVVVAGGPGVGRTTLVRSASEIVPIASEPGYPVAFDFGRLTLAGDLVVYLFGLPAEQRFSFLRDELCRGAHGAVVLIDARRLEDSFEPIDHLESCQVPLVVAVNCLEVPPLHSLDDVRDALSVSSGTPVLGVDARDRSSVETVLRELALRTASLAC